MKYGYRQRGFALMWVAVTMLALIAFAGLAIDTVYVVTVAKQLQNSADAAALAGVRTVRDDPDGAKLEALALAGINNVAQLPLQLLSDDVEIGQFDRVTGLFTVTDTSPNAVRVVARRTSDSPDGPVTLLFGPMFGVNNVGITREAIAMITDLESAGLVVLSPSAPKALDIVGNATLSLNIGPVHVNSSDSTAANLTGNAVLEADQLDVNGNVSISGGASVTGTVNTGVAPMDDPLSGLPAPSYNVANNLGSINTGLPVVLQPGYYSGGIQAQSIAAVTMLPGVYVLGGSGLQLSGQASLLADGVIIYLLNGSNLSLTGQGAVVINPPDPTIHNFVGADTYAGISIFQARDNLNTATISGQGAMNIHGALYFPENFLSVSGSGTINIVGSQIIADTIKIAGSGEIKIDYDGTSVNPDTSTFLVK